MSFVFNNRGP